MSAPASSFALTTASTTFLNSFFTKKCFADFSFPGRGDADKNNILRKISLSQFLYGQENPFFNQIIGEQKASSFIS